MVLYIPRSIFHLAWLLFVRLETFGPTLVSSRIIDWQVEAAVAYGWQPHQLHVPFVLKSGILNLLEPSGPIQACTGIALPFSDATLVTVHGMFWRSNCNIGIPSRFFRQAGLLSIQGEYAKWKKQKLPEFYTKSYCLKFRIPIKSTSVRKYIANI